MRRTLKNRYFLPYIAAFFIALAATAAFSLISALVLYAMKLSGGWSLFFGIISLGGGCFCGGLFIGKKKRRRGIKQGAMIGVFVFALCFIVGIFVSGISFWGAAGKLALCAVCGAAGGVAGTNG